MPLGLKWAHSGADQFYIELYGKIFQNLVVKYHKAKSLDIWFVTWSSGILQRLFKLCPKDEQEPHQGAYGLKQDLWNILVKSYKTYGFDIWYE